MSKSYWEKISGKKIPSSLELNPVIHAYLKEGCEILDIGCGSGKVSIQLASPGNSVTGIDLNREGIELAKATAKNLGLAERLEFRVGDASEMPFGNETFDFVIIQAFLTSVPDRRERAGIMREACRVLKPGGCLYLAEFGQTWNSKIYRERYLQDFPLTKEEGSFLARDPETGEVEFIAHHFSEKELVFLLVDSGFEIDYFRNEKFTTRTGNNVNGFVILAKKL